MTAKINNDEVVKNLRDILKLSDDKLIDIFSLVGIKVLPHELVSFSDKMTINFLNALVIFKRGKAEAQIAQPLETHLTNNVILKKIRVAFELKESDMVAIAKKTDCQTAPKEWSAYFRKQGHKHYRDCPNFFLESILRGLAS